ncbi:exosome complex component MTR3, partial [Tremellales sp. Uapishka_1]
MATFDRRRLPAPENSYPPIYAVPDTEREAGPSKRTDRGNLESRPIYLKTGLISQANGSGYIESGGVKIACAVYGPRPKPPPYSPNGTLNLEVKFAPFASHPRRAPLRDTEPASLSTLLTQLLLPTLQLHLLPKSSLDVYILVLESDTISGVLSSGLTVASAAVADAGIQMNGLGVGAVVVKNDEDSMVDPTKQEENEAASSATIGVMPALNKITNVWLTGETDIEDACSMIEMAVKESKETHTVLARALLEGAEERGIAT